MSYRVPLLQSPFYMPRVEVELLEEGASAAERFTRAVPEILPEVQGLLSNS